MNRVDFMNQLEGLLQNIAPAEREEALQYYNDYFEDAGKENEQVVIEALGNPARVAENIKRDLFGNGCGEGSPQKALASDRALMKYGQESTAADDTRGRYDAAQTQSAGTAAHGASRSAAMPGWAIALVIVLLILVSPVGIGVLGVLFGILVSWSALIFGFGVAAIALFVALLIFLTTGILCLSVDPWVGISLMGGGLLCGGVGILFMMLTVAMAGILTPAVCKGIASLFRKKPAKGVN